jgi:hypothetical protein
MPDSLDDGNGLLSGINLCGSLGMSGRTAMEQPASVELFFKPSLIKWQCKVVLKRLPRLL